MAASEMSEVSSTSRGGSFNSHRNHSMSGKDHHEIRKFDGSNFALWKNQMRDVLIRRRQLRSLDGEANRLEGVTNEDWEELDLLAMSTIRLHLADNMYFTVLDCDSA